MALKSTTKKTTAVVTKSAAKPPVVKSQGESSKALVAAPDLNEMMLAHAGRGFEETTQDAYAIPFLRVLQDLSPQVKSKMSGYVEGAKPGMIFNTVSRELFDEPVRVIPCYYRRTFIEWKPRGAVKTGSGLVAVHPENTPLVRQVSRDDKNRPLLPNGNELHDTRSHFVLIVHEDGRTEGALIAMGGTAIKVSRRWMSQIAAATLEHNGRIIKPPMYAYSYRLGAEEEANDQGSWWTWTVDDRTLIEDADQFRAAAAFSELMRGGPVKVNYDELAPASGDASPRGPAEAPSDLDQDIDA